jgi:hypothetical protein
MCNVLRILAAVALAMAAAPVMAQERGEVPSLGEENALRDLKQDSAIEPGFGVADQARALAIRSLERNAVHSDKRSALSAATFDRLQKNQTARQQTRDARGFNPAQRRDARRRARTDRQLRARINQALKRK